MKQKKTWREKLEGEHPSHGKIVKILIPKPLDVDAIVRGVPEGKLITDEQIREKLAETYQADKICSKLTGMFLRIVAETAEENLRNGKIQITPYWRVVKKDGRLNTRFPAGVEGQASRLKKEGYTVIQRGKNYFVEDYERYLVI